MTDRFRRMTLGVGAILIASGMAAALYASPQNTADQPGPFMGRRAPFAGPGLFWPMQMMAKRLGLSDAQQEQIRGVLESRRDEWKALADRARTARRALHEAVIADPIDEGAIRQRSAELAPVQADIAVAQARVRSEIFQLLTPEQQAQAKALLSQMEQRLGQRRRGRPNR